MHSTLMGGVGGGSPDLPFDLGSTKWRRSSGRTNQEMVACVSCWSQTGENEALKSVWHVSVSTLTLCETFKATGRRCCVQMRHQHFSLWFVHFLKTIAYPFQFGPATTFVSEMFSMSFKMMVWFWSFLQTFFLEFWEFRHYKYRLFSS